MNNLDIICYNDEIPGDVLLEIKALAKTCGINEEYDSACDLVYTWVINQKIVAVIAFKKVLFTDGQTIPRLEHIFGLPEVQKTRRGVMFLLSVEQQIMEYGFKQMWAYIDRTRGYMHDYAIKFGFKEYAEDSKGIFMMKNLTKRRF